MGGRKRNRVPAVVLVLSVALAMSSATGAEAAVDAKKKPKHKSSVTTTTAGSATSAKGFPANVCTLLTAEEVGTLVPSPNPGKPSSAAVGPLKKVSCYWDNENDPNVPSITLAISSLPVPASELKLALQSETGAEKLTGLGDFAIVTADLPIDVEVKALVGNLFYTFELNATGARDRKDAVVALAKTAASRL